MKTRRLLTLIVLLSLAGSPVLLAQTEDQPKKRNWFRRIFQRNQDRAPGKQPATKDAQARPKPEQRKPAAAEDKDRELKARADKETRARKWTEEERRTLEDYLKDKHKGRDNEEEDDDDGDARGGKKNKKDKKNKAGGKGRGKGPAWKREGGLPPGLQKKLDRGGELPPGWQKKLSAGQVMEKAVYEQAEPLPRNVFMTLPPQPRETEIVTIEDKVVRVMKDTRRILDVFGLGGKLSGQPDAPTKAK